MKLNYSNIQKIAYSTYEAAKNLINSYAHLFKKQDYVALSNSYLPEHKIDDDIDNLIVIEKKNTEKEKLIVEKEANDTTRFQFKAALLDRLNEHFYYMNKMKKADKKSYDCYKTQGGVLTNADIFVGSNTENKQHYVNHWFLDKLPTFGCVLFITEKNWEEVKKSGVDDEDAVHPRMVYFRKYDNPPAEIQPIKDDGTVYVVGIFWDSEKNYKFSASTEYAIHLSTEGKISLLKMKVDNSIFIPAKIKGRRGNGNTIIHKTEWGYPQILEGMFRKRSLKEGLTWIFSMAAHEYEVHSLQEMIEIKATKNGVSAIFGVDIEKTPYFFKDRQANYIDGKKKRIFHIVRPHERQTDKGVKIIKTHFRGDKNFYWNGYKISIHVPEWEGSWRSTDFNLGLKDSEYEDVVPKDCIDANVALKQIENHRMSLMEKRK
jgi:hypothetical protein